MRMHNEVLEAIGAPIAGGPIAYNRKMSGRWGWLSENLQVSVNEYKRVSINIKRENLQMSVKRILIGAAYSTDLTAEHAQVLLHTIDFAFPLRFSEWIWIQRAFLSVSTWCFLLAIWSFIRSGLVQWIWQMSQKRLPWFSCAFTCRESKRMTIICTQWQRNQVDHLLCMGLPFEVHI